MTALNDPPSDSKNGWSNRVNGVYRWVYLVKSHSHQSTVFRWLPIFRGVLQKLIPQRHRHGHLVTRTGRCFKDRKPFLVFF